MNSSQKPFSRRSPGRQLRWKELTENKAAFAVGVLIFVVIPSFWTLLLAQIDPSTGVVPGMATAVWLLAGWLFSAVMGAQVVCRDLGTPLESFLVARPVSALQILRVKAWLGFLLVVLLVIIVGGLELFWWALRPEHRRAASMDFGGSFFLASTLNILAYGLAFAAACVTRRALTSMLMSAFVLTLLVTVPLITRLPEWANVTEMLSNESDVVSLVVCFGLVAVSGLVAVAAIRFFHSAERRVALGPRQLTWAAALTLVALLVLAMREVGATQPLVQTWWHSKDYQGHFLPLFAVGQDRVAVSADDGSIRLIDLDDAGQFTRNRRLDPARASYLLPGRLSVYRFVATGNLAMVRNEVTEYRDDQPLADRVRMTVRRLDWETMETLPTIELPWPADLEYPHHAWVGDAHFSGSRLWILVSWSRDKIPFRSLIGYEINEDQARVEVWTDIGPDEYSWRAFLPIFSAPSAGTAEKRICIIDRSSMRLGASHCFDPQASVAELQAAFRHPGFSTEHIAIPMADQFEFKMVAMPMLDGTAQRPWRVDERGVIGRMRMSPWAAEFRWYAPDLLTAGPGRCIELISTNATVYDVSNPERPRRIARYYTPPFSHAEVTGDLIIFNHHLGFSVARLPSIENH